MNSTVATCAGEFSQVNKVPGRKGPEPVRTVPKTTLR